MSDIKEPLEAQVSRELLSDLRGLAKKEGRPLQTLVEEAIANLLEQRRQSRPRPEVLDAYQKSHERFEPLYKKLAE